MTKTKKIVRPTLLSYKRALADFVEAGWTVVDEEQIPRPRNRITYIATLQIEATDD